MGIFPDVDNIRFIATFYDPNLDEFYMSSPGDESDINAWMHSFTDCCPDKVYEFHIYKLNVVTRVKSDGDTESKKPS